MRYDLAEIEHQIINTLQGNTSLSGVNIQTHTGDVNPGVFYNADTLEGFTRLLPFIYIQYNGRTKVTSNSTKQTFNWKLRFRLYTGAQYLGEKRGAQLSAYQMLSASYDSLHGKMPKSIANQSWSIPLLDGDVIQTAFTCVSPLEAPEGENEKLLVNLPSIVVYQSDYQLEVIG